MKKIILILVCTLCLNSNALANENTIKNLLDSHVTGLNKRDINRVSSTIHTISPAFGPYTQMLNQSFQQFKIRVSLTQFDYLGKSGNYAFAKATMKFQRDGGAAFQDNETTSVYVFTKQNGQWKIWNFMQLEGKPI